jgi:hypothetical protein
MTYRLFRRERRAGSGNRERPVAFKARHLLYVAFPVAALGLATSPVRADFFGGARRTFTSDIPHFFQDDIPCAFGGQPTSHTRTSCKSSGQPASHAAEKDGDRATVPSDKNGAIWDTPPNAGR